MELCAVHGYRNETAQHAIAIVRGLAVGRPPVLKPPARPTTRVGDAGPAGASHDVLLRRHAPRHPPSLVHAAGAGSQHVV